MRTISTAEEARHQSAVARERGDRVGLVSTRGDLHPGHASILRHARAQCDLVICTIVRPSGIPAHDPGSDDQLVSESGADLLWRPAPGPLVPAATIKLVPTTDALLAPLATAIAQQLGIIRPHVAYASELHFDHARLLRDVTRDLLLDVEVRMIEAERDEDGLPLGPRSRNLSDTSRTAARSIVDALDTVERSVEAGELSLFRLRARAEARLAEAGSDLQVLEVATVDPASYEMVDHLGASVLLIIRISVEGVELVDSRMLHGPPVSPAAST